MNNYINSNPDITEAVTNYPETYVFDDNSIVKPKIDVVFKKLFGSPENIHILKAFIASMLDIDKNRITDIRIESSELPPDFADEKFGRVDIKCTIDNSYTINIELQACWYQDYKDRTLFYWSKLFTMGFKRGSAYGELRETICINILGFNLFSTDDYHSLFRIKETSRDEYLTDKFAIHFYELNKLPPKTADNFDNPVLQWLWLINSETKEELDMLTDSNIPEIKDAVNVVSYFSKDEQMRIDAFEREMAILDHAAEIAAAKKSGIAEGKLEGKAEGKIEGKLEGKAEAIRALMDNLGSTADEAMDMLRIPSEERAGLTMLL